MVVDFAGVFRRFVCCVGVCSVYVCCVPDRRRLMIDLAGLFRRVIYCIGVCSVRVCCVRDGWRLMVDLTGAFAFRRLVFLIGSAAFIVILLSVLHALDATETIVSLSAVLETFAELLHGQISIRRRTTRRFHVGNSPRGGIAR